MAGPPSLTFLGAAGTVTGSKHLLEADGRRILVDCGLFQGLKELRLRNWEPLPLDPATIDGVVLTHAHLDHCGRLPLLVKRGFRGEIIATAATRALARIVLQDSAHMAEDDAAWRSKHSRNGRPVVPLYTQADVLAALERFGRVAAYGEALQLAPDLSVSYHDAGHILGSAHVLVQVQEGGRARRVLFSGDIGGAGRIRREQCADRERG